ncbi:MAG TPA: helix-turn-helix domain-containing protein [Terracidiphilus sp.]|nr:helix-turn-helix domain-containing protein [Terracidiphilus sp.]
MRERERKAERLRLDEEMRPFRSANRVKEPTAGLLRAIRRTVGIPMAEVAAKSGVGLSEVGRLERAELTGAITLRALARQAEAMGCVAVYGIVPKGGMTLERMTAMREWREILEVEG